jgi:hypothetical protein
LRAKIKDEYFVVMDVCCRGSHEISSLKAFSIEPLKPGAKDFRIPSSKHLKIAV